jgi:hypothetical protein
MPMRPLWQPGDLTRSSGRHRRYLRIPTIAARQTD